MAKDNITLPYALIPNTLEGTDGYHRVLSHVGSKDAAALFTAVASKLHGQTTAGVQLVWNGLIETVMENLIRFQYRSSVNGVTFSLAIPGSTESLDGTPTEGVYVTISPPDSFRNVNATVTPVYSSDVEDEPALTSVENLSSHERGEIAGTGAFRLGGRNISASGDGEAITVTAADGTKVTAEVTGEDGYGKFITAQLPVALSPGKGVVALMTRGKRTPEGVLRTYGRSVTILAGETPPVVPAPTLTEGHSQAHEAETGKMFPQFAFIMQGDNLQGASVHLKYTGQSGTPHDETLDPSNYEIGEDGTELVIGPGGIVNAMESTQVGDTVTVEAHTAGGVASYEAEHAVNE